MNLIKKVCFLDRDGVINIDKVHITKKKQIVIYPDIFEILRYLIKNEYLIIVITNQEQGNRVKKISFFDGIMCLISIINYKYFK